MKAMILRSLADLSKEKEPLQFSIVPDPVPGPREVLLRISACGVCHTELDEIEGRTPPPICLSSPDTRWLEWWLPGVNV